MYNVSLLRFGTMNPSCAMNIMLIKMKKLSVAKKKKERIKD
jgi:hypothetical protein